VSHQQQVLMYINYMVPADTSMYVPYVLREQMYENHIPRSSQDEDNRCIVKNTNCPIIIDREVNIYVYIYICVYPVGIH
jgi:hypothetical protein